jgi:PAS domain S-box-containing protein
MRSEKISASALPHFMGLGKLLNPSSRLARFGFAAACVLAAFVLRYSFAPLLGNQSPFAFFIPSALIAAWCGGTSAGLFALVSGLMLGTWFFAPSHAVGSSGPAGLIAGVAYAGTVVIGVAMIEHLHRVRLRVGAVEKDAERLHREISERARAEESLRLSEERFQLLVNEAKDYAIFMLDTEGRVLSWNAGAQRVKGYTEEEIVGGHFSRFYLSEDIERKKPWRDLEKAAADGRFEDEGWRVRRDGSHYWANVVITALHDKSGKLICYSKLVRDITGRMRGEERVRQSEARFRELADAMPQIVWTAGPDGQVEYVNKKWFEYTGTSAEQTYGGDGWARILHPADRGMVLAALRKALENSEPFEIEKRIRSETGDYRWHLCRGLPVKDDTGHVKRWFATSTDIEDQKRIELDLEQAREQLARHARDLERRVVERTGTLEETIRSLEGVLYHVAHDLRAPLRAMEGFTQILLESRSDARDAVERDCAWRIVAAATRMDQLIKDLLTYGRLSHMEMPRRKINLEAQIDRALIELEGEIKSRRAEIHVARPVPHVWANPAVLDQVLTNLLSNALKFVSPGATPQISIGAEENDEMVRLWIQDNGIGIDETYQEQIFRVFERLEQGEGYMGTGIGLAIVRKGAERMGGSVGVESKPGYGSRFWFEFPARHLDA